MSAISDSGRDEHRVVEDARDVERRLPELVEIGRPLGQLQTLHPHLVETRAFQQVAHTLLVAERERSRCALAMVARSGRAQQLGAR